MEIGWIPYDAFKRKQLKVVDSEYEKTSIHVLDNLDPVIKVIKIIQKVCNMKTFYDKETIYSYHMNCLIPALNTVPDGEWFCPTCAEERAVLNVENETGKYKKYYISISYFVPEFVSYVC